MNPLHIQSLRHQRPGGGPTDPSVGDHRGQYHYDHYYSAAGQYHYDNYYSAAGQYHYDSASGYYNDHDDAASNFSTSRRRRSRFHFPVTLCSGYHGHG